MCPLHYKRWRVSGGTSVDKNKRVYRHRPLADRFWEKVDKTESCWLWTAGLMPSGYGSTNYGAPDYRTGLAHRVSWELLRGPIPAGMHLDHLCRVTRCVNPDHLEIVTPWENTNRGYGWAVAGSYQRDKTHCPQGHAYDEANTHKGGKRRTCRACLRIRSKARRDALKAGVPYRNPFAA